MDSDEKNKFSSNINEFDKNFDHDKYQEAKHDREYMKGHKRVTQDQPEVDIRKSHNDPNNQHLKDPDRMNRPYNETLEMEDINREESPTNKESHHLYIPDAHVKPHKDKPAKSNHNKYVDLPGDQRKEIKREQKDTEIIHNKQTNFSGKTNYAHRKGN
jgi:hypothetical protein